MEASLEVRKRGVCTKRGERMVVVQPTNKSVEAFEGLHLYHGAISNCSMRVRMTLVEKGLDWTSHHVDLKKKENITDDYFGINPKGLVPTLVHNGVVHTESNDIIDYLDNAYGEPSLRAEDTEALMSWLELATSLHVPAVKPYVYATIIAPKVKKTAEEEAKYAELQKNEELSKFHAQHAGGKQFQGEAFKEAEAKLNEAFAKLESTLAGCKWMMGDKFTLADISWIPLHFVLIGCGYPFQNYPNITRWADACAKRQSFKEGILEWCPDFSKV